jgi:hypothetical protein
LQTFPVESLGFITGIWKYQASLRIAKDELPLASQIAVSGRRSGLGPGGQQMLSPRGT